MDIAMGLDQLHEHLSRLDIIPKMEFSNLGNVKILEDSTKEYDKISERAMQINDDFNSRIEKIVIPIRFGILAICSAYKFTVFDDSIVKIMDHIYNLEFENSYLYRTTKNAHG